MRTDRAAGIDKAHGGCSCDMGVHKPRFYRPVATEEGGRGSLGPRKPWTAASVDLCTSATPPHAPAPDKNSAASLMQAAAAAICRRAMSWSPSSIAWVMPGNVSAPYLRENDQRDASGKHLSQTPRRQRLRIPYGSSHPRFVEVQPDSGGRKTEAWVHGVKMMPGQRVEARWEGQRRAEASIRLGEGRHEHRRAGTRAIQHGLRPTNQS